MRLGTFVIIAPLLFLLGGAIVFIHMGLKTPGELIPAQGYIVMGIGTIAGLAVWTTLTALLFYSTQRDRRAIAVCSPTDEANGFTDFNGGLADARQAEARSLQAAHENADQRFDLAFQRTNGGVDVRMAVLRGEAEVEAECVVVPYHPRAPRS